MSIREALAELVSSGDGQPVVAPYTQPGTMIGVRPDGTRLLNEPAQAVASDSCSLPD